MIKRNKKKKQEIKKKETEKNRTPILLPSTTWTFCR
jgi:hypothetical protein